MKDLTHKRNFAEKKTHSVAAATLTYEDFDGNEELLLFKIPEKSVIDRAVVVVKEVGQANLKLKLTVGSTIVAPAKALDSVATTLFTVTKDSGTGVDVKVQPTSQPNSGVFTVIIRYTEYELSDGTLTNYN